MVYVKLGLWVVGITLFAAFLHYHLPQRDIVRILNTEVTRVDSVATGADGQAITTSRDVRQVSSVDRDGAARVFRNEDASLYFKFDSADLAAEADELTSTRDAPRWVVITYYGWRVQFMSWFPNAISVREAESENEALPWWPNVLIVSIIVIVLLAIRRVILLLIARFIDPVVESVEMELDAKASAVSRFGRRVRRFFG
ncbi:MAG: DUF1523 family protein, partial [Pseudomonadota bacterium]